MPDETSLHLDASIMPIHLQYNFLARDQIPLHNIKNSREMEPNLVQSLTSEVL